MFWMAGAIALMFNGFGSCRKYPAALFAEKAGELIAQIGRGNTQENDGFGVGDEIEQAFFFHKGCRHVFILCEWVADDWAVSRDKAA